MKIVDLFSGIGGFSLAGRWAGFTTIQFVEIDRFCKKVLMKNFPNIPIYDDIKTFNYYNKIDLLTAGFPCQPFSIAGKKKGVTDDRYLWPHVTRIIRQSRPTWFIGENVPGIIPHIDTVLKDLENEDYSWRAFLIPASATHAPHKRERIWIIANRNSERRDNGSDNRKTRYIQDNMHRYAQTLQQEWSQFQPESWTTFNAQEWLGFASDTNSAKCSEGTAHNEAEPKRSEWSQFTAEIGQVIGNADSIPGEQTDQRTITESESWTTRSRHPRQHREIDTTFGWQKSQPPIPGVDDGLPNGLDRNKGLGNSIVPQIAYLFMKLIYKIEK